MKKPYLLAFSPMLGTQKEIGDCLNLIPGLTWRYDIPNCFYIVSELSAGELASKVRECKGTDGRFIITEITTGNKEGWLTPESWYFMNNLTYQPKD